VAALQKGVDFLSKSVEIVRGCENPDLDQEALGGFLRRTEAPWRARHSLAKGADTPEQTLSSRGHGAQFGSAFGR
jgi:hypothetical protein